MSVNGNITDWWLTTVAIQLVLGDLGVTLLEDLSVGKIAIFPRARKSHDHINADGKAMKPGQARWGLGQQ